MATKLDAGDACGAREEAEALQADTIAAVNDGRIPPLYHEELVGSVNALVDSIECAPPPPAPAQTEPPADEVDDPEEDEEDDAEDEPGNGKEKGKPNGKKKGKKK